MTEYEYTKYLTTKDRIRETIATYGVAILPNVLDEQECAGVVSGIWDYFEMISKSWTKPLRRDDSTTWKEIYTLIPKHGMLFQHYSVGHAHISWELRQNPKILDVFSTLWNVPKEDLLVSYDGLSFGMPSEVTNRGWNMNHTWYHTDQSYTRNEFENIQSWVTGLDVREGDSTLAFLEGSNRLHKDFATHFKITDKSDWYKLTPEEEKFYTDRGCVPKKIKCPKGCLVFWDSRTIHCGVEPMKTRPEQNFRAVIYLCYTPRSRSTNAQLKKHIQAFEELRTTNHYPCKVKLFAKVPRSYGAELPNVEQIPPPILQPIGRRLVGYEN